MLLVVKVDGVTELNWMWMPSWIGMNRDLRERMQKELNGMVVGKTYEQAHELIPGAVPHAQGS